MAFCAVSTVVLASGLWATSSSAATGITVLPCQTTPLAVADDVSLVCDPATPNGPSVTSHIATVSVEPGQAQLGVVTAENRVFQYDPAGGLIGDAPVSEMIPTAAALAINGGFFDINLGSGAPYSGQACGGMVAGGRIIKTPPLGGTDPSQFVVFDDGTMRIGTVGFSGMISDGASSTPLTSVNDLSDAGPEPGCPPLLQPGLSPGQGITLITPDMGPVNLPPISSLGAPAASTRSYHIANATVVTATLHDGTLTVATVTQYPQLTALPALTAQQVDLVTSAPQTTAWLTAHALPGRTLGLSDGLTVDGAPRDDIQTLLSGSAVLVHNGQVCPTSGTLPAGCGGQPPPSGGHAETMLGLSQDGATLQLIVVDDPAGMDGLTPEQDGPFLAAHGAWNGILFDGGGSSTMIARTAPRAVPELVNNTDNGETQHPPGPGGQRYVANALVVYPGLGTAPVGPTPTMSPTASVAPRRSPAAPVTPAGTRAASPVLADTGAPTVRALIAAVAFLAGGIALLAFTRRARR